MAKSNKPIFDVAHPGKSTPTDNSKSVIINNRPLLKDPMMASTALPVDNSAADTAANDNTDKPEIVETSNKSEPVLETEKMTEPEVPTKDKATPEPPKPEAEPTKSEQPKTNPKTEDPKPETPSDDEPITETKASKDEVAKQAKSESDEVTKRQAATAKLAESKQYYLPINSIEKRRSRRFVAVGILLSLLLIVAWADIALDAGLIHIGSLKAPTHFFSN